jgi:diguanylate cyclase (GGDEF)-like protein
VRIAMARKNIFSLFRLGVRQKVLLVLLTVLLTALSLSGWMALKQEKSDTMKEINQRGSDISRFVAKSLAFSVVGYDYHTLQLLLDEITLSEDINYAKVINAKGNTMAESGELYKNSNPEARKQVLFEHDITLEDDIVGHLSLGLSTENTIQRLEAQKFALVKREAFIILMIAFGEFLALSFIIIRPVSVMSKSLATSVDETGKIVGEVPVISQDEFGNLALQFNHLSSQLNDANEKLQSRIDVADKKLLNTNRQLIQQSEELHLINEKFRKMSITDSLTGLHNRRRFEELMDTEMATSLQHGDVNSVLVIDIDYFKKINDRYGHPCGDAVLKMVARTLKENIRKTDMLCRVGGEEFVALCKRADKDAAISIGKKMCQVIEAQELTFGEDKIRVTISVGVATSLEGDKEQRADCLYRHADIAVYHSKENGRNRVTHYDFLDIPENVYRPSKLTQA